MLTRCDGERLVVRLFCELRGPDVGNPDLNRSKSLFAKSLAMSADTNGGSGRRLSTSHAAHVTCNDDEASVFRRAGSGITEHCTGAAMQRDSLGVDRVTERT